MVSSPSESPDLPFLSSRSQGVKQNFARADAHIDRIVRIVSAKLDRARAISVFAYDNLIGPWDHSWG